VDSGAWMILAGSRGERGRDTIVIRGCRGVAGFRRWTRACGGLVDDLGVKSWGECGRGRGVYINGRCSRSDLDARIFGNLVWLVVEGQSEVGTLGSGVFS